MSGAISSVTSGIGSVLGGAKDVLVGKPGGSSTGDVTPFELRGLRTPFAESALRLLGFDPTTSAGGAVTGGTFLGDLLGGIPQFQGQLAAGITPQELETLGLLPGAAAGGDPLSAARALLTKTLGGGFTETGNPFLQAAIEAAQRPTLQGLEEVLSRTLPGRFTQGGQFVQPGGSSAFDRAAAIATRGTAQSLADIASNLSFATFEAERGRQQEAIAQASQLTSADVDRTVKTLQAQALPRMIEQFGIDRGLEEFQNRVNALLELLGLVSGAPISQIGTAQTGAERGLTQGIGDIFSFSKALS